ncbi:MAG: DNA mismatch repair endonuclease MutL [Firmicutes bacterium]|nr:DNA mismatch repair endonuclease MutL [Bacillota bacterium]
MTARIRRLPPEVRDQIAAGEIVERPASVVKELVENSLDAGARRIEVEVWNGGREQIRVRDNGSGITAEDLPLAVERHATSKLHSVEELGDIQWLGFRGEALAAIAAVSRLTLASRPPEAAFGMRLRVDHGRVGAPEPCAMGVGTLVEVEGLFADVPARRKALAGAGTEFQRIYRVVAAMAIGYPEVAWHLSHDGRAALTTNGQGDGRDALDQVLGSSVAEAAVAVEWEDQALGWKVRGYLLPPPHGRSNRQSQVLFLNRRWVHNWVLRQAIEEAFRPQLPEGRYAAFWLAIELPRAEVDPNAHPAKLEVRIARERLLGARLYEVVRENLRRGGPAVSLYPPASAAPGGVGQGEWQWTGHVARETGPTEASFPVGPAAPTALGQELLEVAPLGQWANKYIVAQGPRGLYLIDQHAAHERVYYERFVQQREHSQRRQPLLIPLAVDLPAELFAAWQRHRRTLEDQGFEWEEMGGTTVMVRALPAALAEETVRAEVVFRVIEGLDPEGGFREGHRTSWRDDGAIALAACKAAIKAYRPLAAVEMEALLRQLAGCEDPRSCPHGRPTVLRLGLEEVDRRFGRSS